MKNTVFANLLRSLSIGVFFCLMSCKQESAQLSVDPDIPEEAEKIVILTWEEYFAPGVIESFEASTGVEVELVGYDNLGHMMGLLRSQLDAYDLVITDDASIPTLVKLKLVSELDHAKLPNKENIMSHHLDRQIDPGNRFTIPYVWGTTLVAYRTDQISDPKHSWDLLWDERLKGKVAMIDERADIYAAALLKGGYSLNSQDGAELDEATDLLVQQIQDLDPVYADVIEARDLLLKGDVWAMIAYSCDAALDATKDENVSYFIPEEGAPIWMDSFAIPRLASNMDGAHQFIDHLSRPKVAAENANYIRYVPPIVGAEQFLDADLAADRGLNPPAEIIERCESAATPTPEREEVLNQGMKKIHDQIRAKKVAGGGEEEPAPAGAGTAFVPAEN